MKLGANPFDNQNQRRLICVENCRVLPFSWWLIQVFSSPLDWLILKENSYPDQLETK
jgi:hypothetical protein